MESGAIGARAIGDAGRAMLTVDFGRTRLAERMPAARELRTDEAGREPAAGAARDDSAPATRP